MSTTVTTRRGAELVEAPFFRGLAFALPPSLALWAGIAWIVHRIAA